MNQMEMEYLISRYVDGSLSEPERRKAIQLIKSNPECRRWFAGHRQVDEVMADWSSRLPMLDWKAFNSELEQKIDRRVQAGNARLHRIRYWLGAVAVAGLAGLIGATLWLAHPPARRDVPSFIQPVMVRTPGAQIPGNSTQPVALTSTHPPPRAALVKPIVITRANHPPTARPSKSLASIKKATNERTITGDLGVEPPSGRTGRGVADASTSGAGTSAH